MDVSVRDLHENLLLVLSVTKGRSFPPKPSATSHIVLVGILDGQSVESNPIEWEEEPAIDIELAWQTDRKTFQALRSHRSIVRVVLYAEDASKQRTHLGFLPIDLREAIPRDEDTDSSKIDSRFRWRQFSGSMDKSNGTPTILACLILESNDDMDVDDLPEDNVEIQKEEGKQFGDQEMNELHPEILPPEGKQENVVKNCLPVLHDDEGFFQLGSDEQATQKFKFQVYLAFAKNLHLVIPRNLQISQDWEFYFTYNLFGTDMTSSGFHELVKPDFLAERATAYIHSNLDLMKSYFASLGTFEFGLVCNNERYAIGSVPIGEGSELDLDSLSRENGVITIDQKVRLHPVGSDANSYENNLGAIPFIGVELVFGYEDVEERDTIDGLDQVPVRDITETRPESERSPAVTDKSLIATAIRPIDIPAKGDPSVVSSTPKILQTPPERPRPLVKSNEIQEPTVDITPPFMDASSTSQEQAVAKATIYESTIKYNFIVDLKEIQMDTLQNTTDIVLRYRYECWNPDNITTAPSFSISPKIVTEVQRGYRKFSFRVKEDDLIDTLQKYPLIVWIERTDPHEKIGKAEVRMDQVLYSNGSTPSCSHTRHCSLTVPVIKSKTEIGRLKVELTAENRDLQQGEARLDKPLKPPMISLLSQSDIQKAIVELEEWKERQKEKFKQELALLESHHLKTMSSEWTKRDASREDAVKKTMLQMSQLETNLREAIRKLDEERREVAEQKQRLEVLKTEAEAGLETVRKQEAMKAQQKVKAREDNLRAEVEGLRAKMEKVDVELDRREQEILRLKRDASGLKVSEVNSEAVAKLEAENAQLKIQLDQALKAKLAYKKALLSIEGELESLKKEKEVDRENRLHKANKENEYLRQELAALRSQQPGPSTSSAPALPSAPARVNNNRTDVKPSSLRDNIARLRTNRDLMIRTGNYHRSDLIITKIDEEIKALEDELISLIG